MVEGTHLRHARTLAQIGLRQMATRLHYNPGYLSLVERGEKPLTEAIISAYERELGMDRRQFMALGGILVADNALRGDLVSTLGNSTVVDHWHHIAADYGRDYFTLSPAALAGSLADDLPRATADLHRGIDIHESVARLCAVQGMVVASLGHPTTARRWYRLAIDHASRSGNTTLEAWARGRQAFRTGYDLGEPREVIRVGADVPSVEAHLALAQAHARLGDRSAASGALSRAYRAFQPGSAGSIFDVDPWRLTLAAGLVHARLFGSTATARILADLDSFQLPPRWQAQADLTMHLARAKEGDRVAFHDAKAVLAALPEDHRGLTLVRLVEEVRCVTAKR